MGSLRVYRNELLTDSTLLDDTLDMDYALVTISQHQHFAATLMLQDWFDINAQLSGCIQPSKWSLLIPHDSLFYSTDRIFLLNLRQMARAVEVKCAGIHRADSRNRPFCSVWQHETRLHWKYHTQIPKKETLISFIFNRNNDHGYNLYLLVPIQHTYY